jgi:hypothetical protein
MPTATKRPPKRYTEGVEILDAVLESSLVFGPSAFGISPELRTREDWSRHWARWRSVIEPKVREYLPGRRAFAAYVVGELEDRPVLVEPPLSNRWFRLYVPSQDGSGRWHYRYPPPFMQSEPQWLRESRVVGAREWERYRESRSTYPATDRERRSREYPLEVGLHE